MKKVIFLAVIVAAAFAANAQSKTGKDIQFSGGIRLALPTGNFHLSHSIGLGAELQAEYALSPQASLTGTTGYTNFFGKSQSYGSYKYKYESVGYIPILVGARYHASENVFIGGRLGYGILTGTTGSGAFNFEPQVGYNADKFQLALGYNALVDNGTLGHLGVSAVYKLN